jgi:hypothetical protein
MVQLSPEISRHVPAALQAFMPLQVAVVAPVATLAQVPVPQVWHAPVHAVPQQNPPAQKVLSHWSPLVHVWPTASTATHALPAPQ